MKKQILNTMIAGVAAALVTACGGAAGSGATTTAARSVSGQLNTAAAAVSVPTAVRHLNDGTCDIEGDFVIRALPAQGDVVDATVDATGAFQMDLATDQTYMIVFFQNNLPCAYLLNSRGEPELVGIGDNDFAFGEITIDENGNFVPENDCEDTYDSDDDGTVDSEDSDFDGDGVDDVDETDTDDDGIYDEYDCDDDGDDSFDSEDSDDDGDSIDDSEEDDSGSDDSSDDSEDSSDSEDDSQNVTVLQAK